MIGRTNAAGGTGATLTVTAPAFCTVSISKDGKTKTKTATADGLAVFRGLATGKWTVTISDGDQQASKTVTVTADYKTSITFFAATLNIAYPAGSTCTATDGVTTLTAPDTSGTWACVVPKVGTWTVTVNGKGWTENVQITQNGQTESVYLDKLYFYKNGMLKNPLVKVNATTLENTGGVIKAARSKQSGQALIFRFENPASGLKSIQIKARCIRTSNAYHCAFVSKYETFSTAFNNKLSTVNIPATSSEQIYNMDLSNISDPIYLWFSFYAGDEAAAELEISEIGGI